jgi:hypothetical protein
MASTKPRGVSGAISPIAWHGQVATGTGTVIGYRLCGITEASETSMA